MLTTRRLQLDQIIPAKYNPRISLKPGDPDYERLKRSIEHFDLVELLVWNRRTRTLISGHQRLRVLKDLGWTEVDVVEVDLDTADEKTLNIAMNEIQGRRDEEKLAELLDELLKTEDLDIELTGLGLADIEALVSEMLQPPEPDRQETFDVEAELAANRPIVTRPGELIELGPQRLLCGDCTDPETVQRLMQSERAILFATDPPYLVGYDGLNHPGKSKQIELAKNKNWSESYGIHWDDADANPDLHEKFIGVAVEHAIRDNAAWYCWHASRRQAMLESVWHQFGAFVHQQIIWAKDRPILTRSWYSWQHEPCYMGWVRPHKPPRVADDYPPTIWSIPTIPAGQPTEHPTSKPLELFEIPIRQHTRPGELCYEPFAGSGTQIIAAQRMGRRCFALEISPRYCDLCVRRYIAFVGTDRVDPELVDRYAVQEAANS